uniref:Putative secreted protein n=1 Tax=Anopheles darlingi TaxID=43151 RepID=A0A2M4D6L4_ANODA
MGSFWLLWRVCVHGFVRLGCPGMTKGTVYHTSISRSLLLRTHEIDLRLSLTKDTLLLWIRYVARKIYY